MNGCPRPRQAPRRRGPVHGAGLLALLLAGAPLSAQAAPRRLELDTTASRVRFEGSATLGDFTAESGSIRGYALLPDSAQLTGGTGRIEIPVATLHTGNALRNKHLRDEMDASAYPLVVFTVERVQPAAPYPASLGWRGTPLVLHGMLDVRGKSFPVDFPAAAELVGDTLHIQGRMALRFTAIGMKPPTRFFGTTKVRDDFTLAFDARFLPARQ